MNKTTEEKIALMKKEVYASYQAMQDGKHNEMADSASKLAMQAYSLGQDIADLQFSAESLESVYKHHVAQTYLEEKAAGGTDKFSDTKARIKWKELHEQYLHKNREYRLAKMARDDSQTLIDVLRTNISLKKSEMNNIGGQV